MKLNQLFWYTFVLVAIFLVLTRWQGANALAGTFFRGYASSVGILQGRNVNLGSGAISGLAR